MTSPPLCMSPVSSSEPLRTPGMVLGSTHSPALSESHSILGSERGGGLGTTESCQSDLPAKSSDSDVSRIIPGKHGAAGSLTPRAVPPQEEKGLL